ncbi:hypothetical protein D3C73_1501370 [compost metagenome]
MAAIRKAAACRQLGDIGECQIQAAFILPQLKLAHAGRIDDDSTVRQHKQLPPRRRMPSPAVVLPDSSGQLDFFTAQPVDEC